ncbi:MAG: ABC transporter ATP-binding protein [Coriobacteriaceae bacterium]|nr:ABC transporter ATP-binding protein [Coriobacteriaceae bacterium]
MERGGAHIAFSHVGLVYDDGVEDIEALHDLSFEAAPGEAIALIGPSGCGKSTTLHLTAGLLAPTGGEVTVNGEAVGRPRQETAFIAQDLGLFPWKTVLQNAALGLVVRKVAKTEALERARAALEQVGLGGYEHSYPKELSGGMKQRLALARAVAMDADLLLMDEPLSAVDALLRESLQDLLLDLWLKRGHTQMLVTHSIEEAVYLGRRILVFSERPATLVADIANPDMGEASWRDSAGFAAKCHEVRSALAQGGERGAR